VQVCDKPGAATLLGLTEVGLPAGRPHTARCWGLVISRPTWIPTATRPTVESCSRRGATTLTSELSWSTPRAGIAPREAGGRCEGDPASLKAATDGLLGSDTWRPPSHAEDRTSFKLVHFDAAAGDHGGGRGHVDVRIGKVGSVYAMTKTARSGSSRHGQAAQQVPPDTPTMEEQGWPTTPTTITRLRRPKVPPAGSWTPSAALVQKAVESEEAKKRLTAWH